MILVFGGNGQLGQEVSRMASTRGVPLTALSHAQANIANANDVRSAIAAYKPALVLNAAGYTKVDLAETEVAANELGNQAGPSTIAQACAAVDIPMVHLSTDYVFDGRKLDSYVESDAVAPVNAYGRAKAAGERAVRQALDDHLIIRTSWVFSEFGHNFLKTMLRLAETREELRVVADQRGAPTSTRDIADAILRIAPRLTAREKIWGTYHYTGSGITTWHGFASRIVAVQARLTGRSTRVVAITTAEFPTPARRPANSELDCTLFERTFGFRGRPWIEETDAIAALVTAQMGNSYVA